MPASPTTFLTPIDTINFKSTAPATPSIGSVSKRILTPLDLCIVLGIILLNIDDQHIYEAEDWIKRSIETNKNYGMMWNLEKLVQISHEEFI